MWLERGGADGAILDAVYDAALTPELWPQVLTDIADATGGTGGILYGIALRRRKVLSRSIGRLDPDCSSVYEERHFENDWAHHMFPRPAGLLVASDEVLSLRELQRTAFYADVLEPQGIGHSQMASLINSPELTVAFTITHSVTAGPMGAERVDYLRRLLPHLRRASQLNLRVERYDALREASLSTLDLLTTGVVILDAWCGALFASRAALTSARAGGLVLRDGVVSAAPSMVAQRLRSLIHQATTGGAGGVMAIPDPKGVDLPLTLLVAPLRGRLASEVGGGFLPRASAVIFVRDPNQSTEPRADHLSGLFDLTRAEARVAGALFLGEDFSVAAAKLGISVNTLKTHARHIFQKVGVNRHSQFVRLLADRAISINPE